MRGTRSKPKLLLVDYNNLVFRSMYSRMGLTCGSNFTGGVFGFVTTLCYLINLHDIDRVLVCKDVKPYYRTKDFPEYKGERKKLDEDTIKALNQTKKFVDEFLEQFRFPVVAREGWEADDIIGCVCKHYSRKFDSIYISSNDTDLYQLLYKPDIYLCKKKGLYGKKDFDEEFGLPAFYWTSVLALCGSHNGVPGINGVGIKTAVKWVKTHGDKYKEAVHDRLGVYTYLLNKRIATLPYPLPQGKSPPAIPSIRPVRYRERALLKLLQRHGIVMTYAMTKALERISEG